jgi:DsbC/DsbD-like thiol-disulfide interchange protein
MARRAAAIGTPFRVSLIGGEFDGRNWQAGLLIELDEGWKTYWRMPGDSGIPPQFDWAGSRNVAGVEVLFPVPHRFRDEAGETIGYKHRVVLPIEIEAADAAEPVALSLRLFFGTCSEVCIPGEAQASLDLGLQSGKPSEIAEVAAWRARVPIAVSDAVLSARLKGGVLALDLAEPAEDVFAESDTLAYFGAPEFSAGGREARLAITGLRDPSVLRAKPVRLTIKRGDGGLEQTLTVE